MTTPGLWTASYGEIGATLRALEKAGVTTQDLKQIRIDPNTAKQVFLAIRAIPGAEITIEVEIDWDLSFEEMIATAHFDRVDGDITEKNFPKPDGKSGIEKVSCVILSAYGRVMDVQGVQQDVHARPDLKGSADLFVGLAFANKEPARQWKFPISLLGSLRRAGFSGTYVPVISSTDDRRNLDLHCSAYNVPGHHRVAAVSK
ncbi:MAG TPA: hypothetical protein VJB93_01760 [Patescibacteria group bacterium]|nr:hypothetical protein [Patescibacteria group bacterium]